jgi:hypothetical protein
MDDRNKYSCEDEENFDRLMNFYDTRPITSEPTRSVEETQEIISTNMNYTDADNHAFDQLMNTSFSAGVVRSSNSSGNSYLVDGYSDNDSSMFDALESAIDDSTMSSQINFVLNDRELEQGPDREPVQADLESFEYSLADKEAFSRLMLEEFGEGDDQISELEITKPVSETSHIKIIDFDKEQAREKSLSRLGRSHIKIRYFD